ncbi:hypothetical protein PR048_003276 [Dryococelus australis]|uniref:Uncharacterized protein n=1 Tax=Dryococelus australis TaxID=614101 RepID=A0ABQ9IMN2_9NEOP|nr:hypothetical protein PR048_003276 [Dryococelus australis]
MLIVRYMTYSQYTRNASKKSNSTSEPSPVTKLKTGSCRCRTASERTRSLKNNGHLTMTHTNMVQITVNLMEQYPRTQKGKEWVEDYPLTKADTRTIIDIIEKRVIFPLGISLLHPN